MKSFNSTDYIRRKYRQFTLKMDKEKDQVVISRLNRQANITEYVRELIIRDLYSNTNPMIRSYIEGSNDGEEKERL